MKKRFLTLTLFLLAFAIVFNAWRAHPQALASNSSLIDNNKNFNNLRMSKEKQDKNLKEAYQKDGAPEAKQKIYNVGHMETLEMRQVIMMFLKKWL